MSAAFPFKLNVSKSKIGESVPKAAFFDGTDQIYAQLDSHDFSTASEKIASAIQSLVVKLVGEAALAGMAICIEVRDVTIRWRGESANKSFSMLARANGSMFQRSSDQDTVVNKNNWAFVAETIENREFQDVLSVIVCVSIDPIPLAKQEKE